MSKYTTELRFILETYAGLTESEGNDSVNDIITQGLPKLFNFDFPIFDEAYREVLERKIVRHFYTREIGYETVGRWKMALENKLNEIMPYYNKLYNSELLNFNPLYTHNITKTGSRTDDKTENESTTGHHNITKGHTGNGNETNGTIGTQWELENDTPQGGLTGVEELNYLSGATKSTDNTTRTITRSESANDTDIGNKDGTRQGTARNVGEYLETVVGYEGKDASELILKYRETFLNIDMMIIKELNPLFMCIW